MPIISIHQEPTDKLNGKSLSRLSVLRLIIPNEKYTEKQNQPNIFCEKECEIGFHVFFLSSLSPFKVEKAKSLFLSNFDPFKSSPRYKNLTL